MIGSAPPLFLSGVAGETQRFYSPFFVMGLTVMLFAGSRVNWRDDLALPHGAEVILIAAVHLTCEREEKDGCSVDRWTVPRLLSYNTDLV
jgi:hypothetical protein